MPLMTDFRSYCQDTFNGIGIDHRKFKQNRLKKWQQKEQ